MTRTDRALLRIVERVGPERLARNPTLVRTALKDLFPEDPLAVSLLTAAVEQGVLTGLLEPHAPVPIEVLGPRLASSLRRGTGVSDPRARWAVAAWGQALGLLQTELPDLPRDGTEPDVAGLFGRRPRTVPDLGSETPTLPAVEPAPATRPDSLQQTVPGTPWDEATVVNEPAPPPSALVPTAASASNARDDDATAISGPAAANGDATGDALISDAPTVVRAERARADEHPDTLTAVVHDETASAARDQTVDLERPVSSPALTDSAPVTVPWLEADTVVARPVVDPETPPAPPRRRRALVAVLAIVVLAVLAAAAVVAAMRLSAPAPLAMSGLAATATATKDGSTTPVQRGKAVSPGSEVKVARGPLELTSGDSVVRLADGARARLDGPTTITLLAGRAFVNAGSSPIEVRDGAGTVRVQHARALAGCVSGCRLTALDEHLTVTTGGKTVRLQPHEVLTAGATTSFAAPDALRGDSWVQRNDHLDDAQSRALNGIKGASVLGSWTVHVQRADLPVQSVRPITFTRRCTPSGCTLAALISMADNVKGTRISGAVTALSAAGDRLSVDYGTHAARCQFVPGTTKPGETDGRESVADTYRLSGSGQDLRLTGSRTTRYTPDASHCTDARYTAAKTAKVAGRRGQPAATDFSPDAQQLLLNFVNSSGTGCAAGSTSPAAKRTAAVRCTYPAKGGAPATVEWATYDGTVAGQIGMSYEAAIASYRLHDAGDCASGPCEAAAPNGHGRMLLAQGKGGPVLITYDPSKARLLVIARGESMRGLRAWWNDQQKTHSVYTSSPLPRVGV